VRPSSGAASQGLLERLSVAERQFLVRPSSGAASQGL